MRSRLSFNVVIPSGARNLSLEESVTLSSLCDPPPFGRSLTFVRDDKSSGEVRLASRGQFKESAKIFRGFNAHDELLQLFALILADHVAAERGELHRDFVLGHRIARITFWNIDARRM